jgi:hypothetical protein
MRKLIFLLAVTLLSQMVVAQQQSDATLEETIQWISQFTETSKYERGNFENSTTFYVVSHSINDLTFYYERNEIRLDDYKNRGYEVNFNLSEVTDIWLRKHWIYDDIYGISIYVGDKNHFIDFYQNKDLATRMFKALKHLCSFYPQYKIEIKDRTSFENKF